MENLVGVETPDPPGGQTVKLWQEVGQRVESDDLIGDYRVNESHLKDDNCTPRECVIVEATVSTRMITPSHDESEPVGLHISASAQIMGKDPREKDKTIKRRPSLFDMFKKSSRSPKMKKKGMSVDSAKGSHNKYHKSHGKSKAAQMEVPPDSSTDKSANADVSPGGLPDHKVSVSLGKRSGAMHLTDSKLYVSAPNLCPVHNKDRPLNLQQEEIAGFVGVSNLYSSTTSLHHRDSVKSQHSNLSYRSNASVNKQKNSSVVDPRKKSEKSSYISALAIGCLGAAAAVSLGCRVDILRWNFGGFADEAEEDESSHLMDVSMTSDDMSARDADDENEGGAISDMVTKFKEEVLWGADDDLFQYSPPKFYVSMYDRDDEGKKTNIGVKKSHLSEHSLTDEKSRPSTHFQIEKSSAGEQCQIEEKNDVKITQNLSHLSKVVIEEKTSNEKKDAPQREELSDISANIVQSCTMKTEVVSDSSKKSKASKDKSKVKHSKKATDNTLVHPEEIVNWAEPYDKQAKMDSNLKVQDYTQSGETIPVNSEMLLKNMSQSPKSSPRRTRQRAMSDVSQLIALKKTMSISSRFSPKLFRKPSADVTHEHPGGSRTPKAKRKGLQKFFKRQLSLDVIHLDQIDKTDSGSDNDQIIDAVTIKQKSEVKFMEELTFEEEYHRHGKSSFSDDDQIKNKPFISKMIQKSGDTLASPVLLRKVEPVVKNEKKRKHGVTALSANEEFDSHTGLPNLSGKIFSRNRTGSLPEQLEAFRRKYLKDNSSSSDGSGFKRTGSRRRKKDRKLSAIVEWGVEDEDEDDEEHWDEDGTTRRKLSYVEYIPRHKYRHNAKYSINEPSPVSGIFHKFISIRGMLMGRKTNEVDLYLLHIYTRTTYLKLITDRIISKYYIVFVSTNFESFCI